MEATERSLLWLSLYFKSCDASKKQWYCI